jgi:membrane protein
VLTDIRGAVHRFNGAQGFLLGAALSFAFLLCLAPLALLFFSGTGYLLASDQAAGSVITIATSLLPGHSSEIRATLDLLNRERRVTGVLGVIGLAIFATPLFALMRTALNAAFRVQKARGLVHGFAFDLFALAVIGFLAIALAAALLMLATLANITAGAGTPAPFLTGVWVRAVAPALLYVTLLGLLLFVYRTFPNTGVSTRAAVTSTLIVAALWEIARRAFAVYLTSFGTYGKLYGSFGVAAATLAWIYYSATIFVFGAGLTAVLTERYRGAAPEVELVAFDAESVRGPRSRLAAYSLSAAIGAIAVLLAVENTAPIPLALFGWVAVDVPLASVILGAVAAGALATGLPLWIARASLRSKMRDLDHRRMPNRDDGSVQ